MRYMNAYDVDMARDAWHAHPVLGPAVATLSNLMDWTNRNSDGWAYWPKPCRAAARLMEMIERDGTSVYKYDPVRPDVSAAEYRKALTPIRAFRTRFGADFDIVEVS